MTHDPRASGSSGPARQEGRVAIASLATAVPPHVLDQAEFLALTLDVAPEFRSFAQLFANTGIERRHLAAPSAWYKRPHGWVERNALFAEAASPLVEEVARKCLAQGATRPEEIDAVVVASTTGIAVPGLEARLANRLGLRADVERLPLFGLGCAGGVTGLARAADIARSRPGRNVLFAAVELCTINGRVGDRRMANFISAALFGDGAAGALLRSLEPGEAADGRPLIGATGEHMWPATEDVMGWSIETDGFGVVISPEIPRIARDRLKPAMDAFLARKGLRSADIAGVVLHPGGRKVLEAAEAALGLPRDAFRHAWQVLADFGNMSSPTALFVLERTLRERPAARGRHLMAALGPGFTVSFALLDLG